MNRTQAFLLPPLPLEIGIPVIDKSGRRGVVVDKWFCRETKVTKVRVCRIHRYNKEVRIDTSPALEVRVDLTNDIGFVHALREYLKIVNAESREEVKAYVWTWGGVHEQVVRWWAAAISEKDEQRLIKKLIGITKTEEH
tara:strand:+ start:2457 stop:2873 length:417 start_codon:yes stop_codon:yes gene_type:complete